MRSRIWRTPPGRTTSRRSRAVQDHIVIDRRFRGPPDSGNGGYSCGTLGTLIDGAAEVTLRMPPPLDTPLVIENQDGDAIVATHHGKIVIEARPTTIDAVVPPSVSLADAEKAASNYEGFDNHAFPACFVCGPERPEGDGLRIFPGALGTDGACAAPWIPTASVADSDGMVRPEVVWAALDCPTGWATYYAAPDGDLALLGRLTARILLPIEAGTTYVCAAWASGSEGRKHFATGAVISPEGTIHAASHAVWVELKGDRRS
jgi:hypothetical protein